MTNDKKPEKDEQMLPIILPKKMHREFKAAAAKQGKSMKSLVLEFIKETIKEDKEQSK